MVMHTTTAQKKIAATDGLDYHDLIGPVARHFWGEPNEQLSKPSELRFGCHGSKSVDLEKNQFFDHEAGALEYQAVADYADPLPSDPCAVTLRFLET